MPKYPTYPVLFDNVLQLNISKLKEWGYLNIGKVKSGTVTWSNNGNKTGSISVMVNTRCEQPFIELDYSYGQKPRKYKITMVTIPSNLSTGKIWYFLCPKTLKKCRKLYSVDGYFLHRNAFNGCMYESQIQSKYYKLLDKTYGASFKLENLYEQIHKKHFKKFYSGLPTKRYLKLSKMIARAEKDSFDGYFNLKK